MFLIDTDIIIYSLKAHAEVQRNFNTYENLSKSISVITYGELLYGARKSRNANQSIAVVHKIGELFPIVEISRPIIETFSELKANLHKGGTPLDDMDLLIASTALTGNYILVTNNYSHFSRIQGLKLSNWTQTGKHQ